jgi:hypothetical protein
VANSVCIKFLRGRENPHRLGALSAGRPAPCRYLCRYLVPAQAAGTCAGTPASTTSRSARRSRTGWTRDWVAGLGRSAAAAGPDWVGWEAA